MIEVFPNLHVGSERDEQSFRGQARWFFIHACKEPYHRQALGYTGRAAAKTHPEYLIARRNYRLILNLVDVDNPSYISFEIIDAALDAIKDNIQQSRVLLHCNQGQSRSPSIALLYLLKHTDRLTQMDMVAAIAAFRAIYQSYAPARGMAEYIRLHWHRYARVGSP
jgi:predicted protein tyrosine phosphatase